MIGVLQRYRIIIILLCLAFFIFLLWLFISGQSTGKIPSRGVFVMREGMVL